MALQITAPKKLRFFLTLWRLSFLSVQKVGVLLVPGSENGQPLLSIPPKLTVRWKPSISRYDTYTHCARLVSNNHSYSLYGPESQLVTGSALPKSNAPMRSTTRSKSKFLVVTWVTTRSLISRKAMTICLMMLTTKHRPLQSTTQSPLSVFESTTKPHSLQPTTQSPLSVLEPVMKHHPSRSTARSPRPVFEPPGRSLRRCQPVSLPREDPIS